MKILNFVPLMSIGSIIIGSIEYAIHRGPWFGGRRSQYDIPSIICNVGTHIILFV